MMATPQDQKIKLGEAGELLVASRLLSCGLVAGQLPRGYKADDLYVERGSGILHIQVKTRVGPLSWPTGEVVSRPNRYYALVHFDSLECADLSHPVVYFVPSKVVARAVALHTEYYLEGHPNQKGQGVLAVADPWRMDQRMSESGFGRGWLEKYREPWQSFRDGKLK